MIDIKRFVTCFKDSSSLSTVIIRSLLNILLSTRKFGLFKQLINNWTTASNMTYFLTRFYTNTALSF